jgi:hypothetical protein
MTNHLNPREARDRVAKQLGFDAAAVIRVGDEDFEIPSPAVLDDDQQQAYNELKLETESWDREDDVTLGDGRVIRGEVLIPHRKNKKLITPPYAVKLAIALWGKEKYERYKAGGGISSQILIEWQRMDRQFSGTLKSEVVE